jgi:hypothetical protein
MDLRTFMTKQRVTGAALIRAAKSAGFHLTDTDVSNVKLRKERYYPPSDRVRLAIWQGLKRIGFKFAEIRTIEDLTAE